MPTIADLEGILGELAPLHLAQSWDNVGLVAGDRVARVTRSLLCIDMTNEVVAEALRLRANLIVSYHPPIFKPIKSIAVRSNSRSYGPTALFNAIRNGIAIYSPHTALDAADGGTGDAIAALAGAAVIGPLDHAATPSNEVKVVVFVPCDAVDKVASAMFDVGAGRIGQYEQCSFRVDGMGTFYGNEQSNPRIGQRGRTERVDETRLEVVCRVVRLPDVVAAIRESHPYEEPAFDVYQLVAKPINVGIGRLARLNKPEPLGRLAARLARVTKAAVPQLIGDRNRRVRSMAILVGSAGRVDQDYPESLAADVLVTGEMRHHDALVYKAMGFCAIALGHWPSERPVLRPLAAALRKRVKGVDFRISKADRDPFDRVR